jgi:hypothetical protein
MNCSELNQRVMYDCMRIMGGFAYRNGYPMKWLPIVGSR